MGSIGMNCQFTYDVVVGETQFKLDPTYGILKVRLGVPVDTVHARRLLLLNPRDVPVLLLNRTSPVDCQTPVDQVFEVPPACQAPPSSRTTSRGYAAVFESTAVVHDVRFDEVTSRSVTVLLPPETAQSPLAYATLQMAFIGLDGSGDHVVPLFVEVYPFVPTFDPTTSAVELLNAMARMAPVSPIAAVQVVRFDASAVQTFDETRK